MNFPSGSILITAFLSVLLLHSRDVVEANLQWKATTYNEDSRRRRHQASTTASTSTDTNLPQAFRRQTPPLVSPTPSNQQREEDEKAQSSTATISTTTVSISDGYEVETVTDERIKFDTTKAGELARQFDQVLVDDISVNGKLLPQEIHVGKFLIACEQLSELIHSVGFVYIAKNIISNIERVRNVYDSFPEESMKRDSFSAVLQYEKDLGTHLSESSATNGLLWLTRITHHQYETFEHLLRDGEPYEAARTAYEIALKPHFSWTVRPLVEAALFLIKPFKKSTILSRVGGFDNNDFAGSPEERATVRDLQFLLDKSHPVLEKSRRTFKEFNLVQA